MPTRPFSSQASAPAPSSEAAASWHERAARWMGGGDGALSGSLPQPPGSDLGWVQAVEKGLPVEALESVLERGVLSWKDVQALVLPRRTFSHRKEKSGRLTSEESDRLVRLLRALAEAEETFQSREKARRWLRKPNRALGGEVPFELLRTAGGARLVEQVLGRIAHGIFG